MKRIFFTIIVLLTMSVNAQITDTVKVMNVHTKYDYVEEIDVENIDYINFDNEIIMNVSSGNTTQYFQYNINDINFVDFSNKVYHDKINVTPEIYNKTITKEDFNTAKQSLDKEQYLQRISAGAYCLRGGKYIDGYVYKPVEHSYQRQYCFGTDLYAQYFVIPHYDFMYGKQTSTYDISAEFNNDPLRSYSMVKDALLPVLNHSMINSIPEIKAITLLYYCLSAQENADLSGPYTYIDDILNKTNYIKYNELKTIYYNIVNSLDNIVACLNNFENRPDWYKEEILNIILEYNFDFTRSWYTGYFSMNPYIKLANSLKLRMAMHIVKVEPETAKKWAEEAVANGVIKDIDDQMGFFQIASQFTHPLVIINSWGDLRLSASFESLLMSLDHPYTKTLFLPNRDIIINRETGEVLKQGTRICGIRSGVYVGKGQTYTTNMYQAYSTFDSEIMMQAPLYFIKWAEVDFLRAEGALRGWNMGGTAQELYERGIVNADLVEPLYADLFDETYANYVDKYMAQTKAIKYTNIDPIGDGEPWKSVTNIGVKWNFDDSLETKLEKIITQKYIALFPLSTEAWTELRRTGYPKLFPVLNTDDGDGSIKQGEMIRRIPLLPNNEKSKNRLEKALGGPDKQATRLWWDVDKANF